MDILSLQLFHRVAARGALTAAAQDLSLSPAAASARLAKLEHELGFRLFNRTTRAVSLTTDGAGFLPYVQQVLETLESGLSSVSGDGAEAKGLLRMTMPGSFGRMHIVPLLAEFQSQNPLVTLDLRLSDEILDVVEGGYDLIIRNASLQDSNLVARKLAMDRRVLVASPDYLERYGSPASILELKQHRCVILAHDNRWKFQTGETVTVSQSVVANDGEATRTLLENGMGIGIKSIWNAYESLRSGILVEVLPNCPLVTSTAIWALYPSQHMVPPKVRAMIDFLIGHFQPNPPWEKS